MKNITHKQLRERQQLVRSNIESAFNLLCIACADASDLQGYAQEWERISKLADDVQDLCRHFVHAAPPEGRDGYQLVTVSTEIGQTVTIL